MATTSASKFEKISEEELFSDFNIKIPTIFTSANKKKARSLSPLNYNKLRP
jgi:hypothetical protein